MFITRVLTGIIGIPLLLFFVYLGGYIYGLLLVLLAVIGLREYYTLMEKTGWGPVPLPGYVFIPLLFYAVYLESISLTALLWVLLFAFFSLLPVFLATRIKYWESALSFWGIVYVGALSSFLLAIRLLPEGFYLTVIIFAMVWASDITAYLVGSSLGRIPLAKKVSPKKTVEGTLGGIAGSCAVGLLLASLLPQTVLTVFSGGLLGILVGGAGALGDLTQSALKRSVNAKDSGTLFPGHGGVLDRFDSLFFAAPLFYAYIIF